jgi:SagB-type dehydrogenase family enzyme
MRISNEYLNAILRRPIESMEPAGFTPDWADSPRHAKFYPDVEGIALPVVPGGNEKTLDEALRPFPDNGDGAFTLPVLSDLLLHSYGQLGRRLAINANSDVVALPEYPTAKWFRGTASGGGIYPVSVYWVTGARGPVLPGVYHYSPGHHVMHRLLTGDVTSIVAEALGTPSTAGDVDQYLVLGVKFWQNSFKYGNFSYHAVTMDVGTILQSWRMLAAAHALPIVANLWFDEPRLGELLGVCAEQEGIFAVVPLRAAGEAQIHPLEPDQRGAAMASVRCIDQERSRQVLAFELAAHLHEATVADCTKRPDEQAIRSAAAFAVRTMEDPIVLPPASVPLTGVADALRKRESSFGRFSAEVSLSGDQLSTVLAAGAAAARFVCDVTPEDGDLALVKQYVFANHVEDIDAGVYEYDSATNALQLVKSGDKGAFLQRHYLLENYNLEQAGAVLVPTVRVPALLKAIGDRGYRLANAVVAAVAQAVYTASGAMGVGCGVALGLHTPAYIAELDLDGTDEIPLLIIMVGHEGPRSADYSYDLI